ncbi:MAG TPA: putative peptidoglycan glycosyltransferase FtsW [Candidatus Saccharimonadales bacterium]|nr:putative peptidoglycan glycosyltransferase FtsW [Candidatus Saccharimonadales bacterium]
MQIYKLRKRFDPSIPIVGLSLTLLGLVMILSASQVTAAENYGNPYYFFLRQLLAWGLGLIGFLYFWRAPIDRFYQWRKNFLWIIFLLLIAVFLPGLGEKINGSYRWIGLAGHKLFQPTELVRIFLIIYLSAWLAAMGDNVRSFTKGALPFAILIAAISTLLILEPDTDTVVALLVTSLAIFFVAKAKFWHILLITLAAVAIISAIIFLTPYRHSRFSTATQGSSATALSSGYHAEQAQIAIGSGGWWGVGFGKGISKYAYLPESYSDSIFAVIAEELGFVRTLLVVLAFIYLVWRGYLISLNANSRFVQLMAVGISTLILVQMMINIGGMLGILPLSGITLPFVSYGGTSLVVNMAMLGLLTNISRETI